MKNIDELENDLDKFVKKLKQNLIMAQEKTAEQIKKDVIKHLGHSSGKYVNSIKKSNTKFENNVIKTQIYTDLKSKDGYFIGRMIENGTGIYALEPHIGHTKTFRASGYQYWYVPANEVDRPLGKVILIDGVEFYIAKAQKPKPHWKPALEEDIKVYNANISQAVKEAL